MHSDTAIAALRDIEHHIALAVHFATGFDYDTFRGDPRTVYAVTCCLEILSEASRRLPDELKARHPAIAWKDMAGAGNIYRHDYVWDAVQIDLPPLRVEAGARNPAQRAWWSSRQPDLSGPYWTGKKAPPQGIPSP
jgi:uncharacterized protein with HEPN domain